MDVYSKRNEGGVNIYAWCIIAYTWTNIYRAKKYALPSFLISCVIMPKQNNKIPQNLFLVNIVKYLFFPEILIKKVTNLTDATIRDTILANLTPPNTEI